MLDGLGRASGLLSSPVCLPVAAAPILGLTKCSLDVYFSAVAQVRRAAREAEGPGLLVLFLVHTIKKQSKSSSLSADCGAHDQILELTVASASLFL